jgi:hypothetical protein
MNSLALLNKARQLRRATVVAFDCDGCMAHDHKLKWIGHVVSVGPGLEGVHVRVIKEPARGPMDARDTDLGTKRLAVEDTSLQWVAPGLFFWYR